MFLRREERNSIQDACFELKVLEGVLYFLDERCINPPLGLSIVVSATRASQRLACGLDALDCLVNSNIARSLIDVFMIANS